MQCLELPWLEPSSAFTALANEPGLIFFDSAATGDVRSEVSYLCFSPITHIRLDIDGNEELARLARWRSDNCPQDHHKPESWPFPFAGGAAGWLGYDLGLAAAGIKSRFTPMPGLPGGWFGLYDTIIGFDHAQKRAWALAAERPGVSAAARIKLLMAKLTAMPGGIKAKTAQLFWQAETLRAEYDARLARLHAYIEAGDVYQANFTTRFMAARDAAFSPAAYYLALRSRSPAPFACYIACEDGTIIAGASPERFLRLDATGRVETRPIKGTAPRYRDEVEDRASADALRASAKERAENLMIVDLLRNDLGKVCEVGSIAVPELFSVESYAQAHHLVSAITGQLREGLKPEDLLRAAFPGGSITGAPKRRAMEIIDELEAGPRGAYCGIAGWMGFDGAMDSSIIIRSLVVTPDCLFAQAGGGITWDSETGAEYDEMMLKISPLLACDG